ncbi:MAG: hypothetical protein CMP23_13120 [Rickettsiales bacterium]|nr:hypothetical protein [Rickettsiales bacterium]|tara:strand:- start:1441 stop:1890 length:450 start_codon:yes stop_codon:yes gene_type:complete
MSEEEAEEVTEAPEGALILVGAVIDPAAIVLVEASLHQATHLRPLWERLVVGEEPEQGRTVLGLPLSNKVTSDSIDNHSRHLFSLLNLLGVPLVTSPMMLERYDLERSSLRRLNGPAPRGDKKKKEAEAAAKAKAAAEAAEAKETPEKG